LALKLDYQTTSSVKETSQGPGRRHQAPSPAIFRQHARSRPPSASGCTPEPFKTSATRRGARVSRAPRMVDLPESWSIFGRPPIVSKRFILQSFRKYHLLKIIVAPIVSRAPVTRSRSLAVRGDPGGDLGVQQSIGPLSNCGRFLESLERVLGSRRFVRCGQPAEPWRERDLLDGEQF